MLASTQLYGAQADIVIEVMDEQALGKRDAFKVHGHHMSVGQWLITATEGRIVRANRSATGWTILGFAAGIAWR